MSSSKEIRAQTKVYWQTDTISVHSENKQGLNHPHKRLLIVLAVECVGGSKNPCQWRAAKPRRRKLPDLGPIGQSRIYPCTSYTLYDPILYRSALGPVFSSVGTRFRLSVTRPAFGYSAFRPTGRGQTDDQFLP